MQLNVMVLGVQHFRTKSNETRYSLACLDMDLKNRMVNTFEYQVSAADQDKFGDPNLLNNCTLNLGVSKVEAGFSNMMRFSGAIVDGKDTGGKKLTERES